MILPVRTEASDLQQEEPIIVQETLDFIKERAIATNSNMLYVVGVNTGEGDLVESTVPPPSRARLSL